MADRGASAAVITESAAAKNRPVHLMEFYFDSAAARVTDAYRSLVWNGYTFNAQGGLIEFSGVTETAELQVTEARITRSGVDQSLVAAVLAENVIDRRVTIYKAFLDANEAVLSEPVLIFDGRMDAPVISEEVPESLDQSARATCAVTVSATSHFVDFERRPGRHTNHHEQQLYFPGDKGFEFVSELNRAIIWGR